jgi:hypothetical protein
MNTTTELNKLRKAVVEEVRRGTAYDDWMAECVLRLSDPDQRDQVVATSLCSMMWHAACASESEGNEL